MKNSSSSTRSNDAIATASNLMSAQKAKTAQSNLSEPPAVAGGLRLAIFTSRDQPPATAGGSDLGNQAPSRKRRDRQECLSYCGKFDRGCSVTLFTTTLGSGRSVPSLTGAPIIISAVLMPSITRPN